MNENTKEIDAIKERVERLGIQDHILAWDRRQGFNSKTQGDIDARKRAVAAELSALGDVSDTDPTDAQKALLDELLALDTMPAARVCDPSKGAHGRLQVRGDGNALMCCALKPAPCNYAEPISRG